MFTKPLTLRRRNKVAVKIFKDPFKDVKKCMDQPEVKVMTKIKHQNLVTLKRVIFEKSKLYLVMELCQMSLSELIENKLKVKEKFSTQEIQKYMTDIIKGVQHLHSCGYIHRDVKPDNILVDEKGSLKLTDFGTIKNMKDKLPFTNYVSTRWYRAPECILEVKKYDEKSDVFAIGCIFAELFKLKPMFCGSSSSDQLYKYIDAMGDGQLKKWAEGSKLAKKFWVSKSKSHTPKLQEVMLGMSYHAFDLLSQMLCINPDERISLDKVLKHPFFDTKASILKPKFFAKIPSTRTEKKDDAHESSDDKFKPKKIIKNYITKLKDRENISLSKVNECENETSREMTPYKKYKIKVSEERSKSKFYFQKDTQGSPSDEMMTGISSSREHFNFGDKLSDGQERPMGMKRVSSLPRLTSSPDARSFVPSSESWRFNNVQKPEVKLSKSRQNSAHSGSSSSGDELDILQKKVEEQKTVPLPSLKNYLAVPMQSNSRSSLSISKEEELNKIDKYFQDIRGNSILSTLSSSNDLFSNITTKNESRRGSIGNTGHTVRGLNAGNQVVFGSGTQSIPNFPSLRSNDNHLYSQSRQYY
ncbi:unnamed protein product [Moneuplotes crassus]|uniref:Protein kinase domain-containing protein n=1 Tax=Euplotes crassus TaxID=5936 RepID=A0AAD1Y132_EUPCR|nr:unnamed protein product [Moneuplotes crassus]